MYKYKLKTPSVQSMSLVVVRLEFLCGTVTLASGTGFLEEMDGQIFLITNWHCVTGRSPSNGRTISTDGITPDAVRVCLHRWDGANVQTLNPIYVTIKIDYGSESRWIMHTAGQSIDVAACRMYETELNGCLKAYISKLVMQHESTIQVGSEVFVLGFPAGLTPTGSLPIWKRGSIASEPFLPANGEPCFWIDAATRRGMSGSPVFVRDPMHWLKGPYKGPEDDGEKLQTEIVQSKHLAFVGVYSGRMKDDVQLHVIEKDYTLSDMLFEAQIGKVWHPDCVGAILTDGISLDYEEH